MTKVYRWSFTPVQRAGVGTTNTWMDSLRTSYRRERMEGKKDLLQEVLVKVIFDQLFFQAFFLNLYLVSTSMFEGKTMKETFNRCKRDFHAAWGYSIGFWVPAQTINFALVAARHQSTFVIVLNSVWQTILSLLYHQRDYGKPAVEADEDADPSATAACAAAPAEEQMTPEAMQVSRLNEELARLQSQSTDQLSDILELRQQIEHLLKVVEVQAQSLRAICANSKNRLDGESGAAVLSAGASSGPPSSPTAAQRWSLFGFGSAPRLLDAGGAQEMTGTRSVAGLVAAASLSAVAGGFFLLGSVYRRGDN